MHKDRRPTRATRTSLLRRYRLAFFIAILIWAALLRLWRLDAPHLWVDEAESCINALTILDHGVPTDRYLDIPIYENTLTIPSPDDPEYEFRDSSYSRNGLAIYHGWLPLYSIASSLAAFGVTPDHANDPNFKPFEVRHDEAYMRRTTLAARIPAVVFGLLFLLLLFVAGREMYGKDAAWGAFLIGAFSSRSISIAREARYYSATVLFGTACCFMLWRMCTRGRWRDFLLGGVIYVFLFHTHLITFAVACAGGVACLAFLRWQGQVARTLRKLVGFLTVVIIGTVPWVISTRLLEQTSGIPPAWRYLNLPRDIFEFAFDRPYLLVLLGCGIAALIVGEFTRHRLPPRIHSPLLRARGPFYFLMSWMVLAYLAFVFLMPAVSYSFQRMTLPMLGPGLLLAAITLAAGVRIVRRIPSPAMTSVVFLLFMGIFAGLRPWKIPRSGRSSVERAVVAWMKEHGSELRPGSRIYATPNRHLLYTLFMGIPVQSIAPIRKTFLDDLPADVVLIEDVVRFQPPARKEVIDAAAQANVFLPKEQAEALRDKVVNVAVRRQLTATVRSVRPPLTAGELPPYLSPLVESLEERTAEWIRTRGMVARFPAIFRSYPIPIRDWTMRWQVYFYRFSNPQQRMGENLNFSQRMKNSTAWVMEKGSIIYVSPPAASSGG